jgi:hypothetical protein
MTCRIFLLVNALFADYLRSKSVLSLHLPTFNHAASGSTDQEQQDQEQLQLALALSLSEAESTSRVIQPEKSSLAFKKPSTTTVQEITLGEDEEDLIQTNGPLDYEQKLDQLLQGLKELESIPDYSSLPFRLKNCELQKLYSECLTHRLDLMQSMNKYKNKMDELVHLSSLFLDARTMYQDILRMDEAEG